LKFFFKNKDKAEDDNSEYGYYLELSIFILLKSAAAVYFLSEIKLRDLETCFYKKVEKSKHFRNQ